MAALVIAEKPSVAMALAKVIGARERKEGYMEGNGYLVSWCVGHLVALCDAAEYEERYAKWCYDDLPIVPEEWKHKVLEGTKKQFGILKKLMNSKEVTEIICATDAGREGELIFRLVYEQAGCTKPIKRLWISSMEESSIRSGFENLKDGSCYDSLYQSALCRAKADWLVGINASRLFSVLYRRNLKVGRVQTPTLAMIVERNQKIKEFVKEKYYVTHLKFMEMDAVSEHFKTKEEAEQLVADCNNRMCQVEQDEEQTKTVKPPKLYDLTTLQREANRIFGYTAQQTLDAAQALYEKRLLTYPRTDSRYLTDDMGYSTEKLIEKLKGVLPFGTGCDWDVNVRPLLDSGKVSDHHAIIPTTEVSTAALDGLKEAERQVLYLVCARLFASTADSHIYVTHKCQVICNHHTFYVNGRNTRQEGFKALEKQFMKFLGKEEKQNEEEELEIFLGKNFGPCNASVSENYTQPPRQYTEDTLLSSMERAGNEDLTEETERKGLGTPATRAAIIEKLISSGFVKREKKNLVPTDNGNTLITVLPDEIKSPKMTAEWEMELNRIASGEQEAEVFLDGITEMLSTLVQRYHGVSDNQTAAFSGGKKESIGECPRCRSEVYEGQKSFYCSNKECSFCLWKNNRLLESQGKKMDKASAKKFLAKGKVHYKDLHSAKSGKSYEATIVMVDSGDGNVGFQMEFPKK